MGGGGFEFIDTVKVVNNGVFSTGQLGLSPGLYSKNGGTLVNNPGATTTFMVYTFGGGNGEFCIVENYGNFTSEIEGTGASEIVLYNYGIHQNYSLIQLLTIFAGVLGAELTNIQQYPAAGISMAGSVVYLDNKGTTLLNIYGAASTVSNTPAFDQFLLENTYSCELGGELRINFAGYVASSGMINLTECSYTPSVGEQYQLITMPNSGNKFGGCSCQFSKVTTTGLAAGLSVGLAYDQTEEFSEASWIYLNICSASNTSCTSMLHELPMHKR